MTSESKPNVRKESLVDLHPGFQEPHNLEPRAHCMVMLDTSGSMARFQQTFPPAWKTMVNELNQLPVSRLRIELAVASFNSQVTLHDYAPIPFYLEKSISLDTGGLTLLGTALKAGVERTLFRRQQLAADGIQVHRSVMIVVTDGAATDSDELAEILPTLHRLDREGVIEIVPIALDNDCRPLLTQVFGKEPSSVSELDFALLFRAIAKSMNLYSRSSPGFEPSACDLIAIAYRDEVARLEDQRDINTHARQILPRKK